MQKFLLCYDVSDNRERLKVEKLAARFGLRVQKSFFWCAQPKGSQELQDALERLQLQTGSVLLLPAPHWAAVQAFGAVQPVDVGDEAWLVV